MSENTESVVQEIVDGQGMTLSEVARLTPASRGSGRVCSTTVLRWVRQGVTRNDGAVVTLAAARVGTRWLTSRPALVRFIHLLTPTETGLPATIGPPAMNVDPKRVEAAKKKLAKVGV